MRLARLSSIVAVLLSALVAAEAATDTLHTIHLRNRPASELQPLIQPLLRADEAISGSGYRLFLRASQTRRDDLERLIATLDVAARQLTVTLRHTVARDAHRSRDSVSGEVGVGDRGRVVIGDAPANGHNGRGRDDLRYRFERHDSSVGAERTQTLRVQDGQRAFVRVGQSVPAVERVLVLTGRRSAAVAEGVRYQDFVTGFDVLPRVRGERVLLEITPKLARPEQPNAGTYRFQDLQTTVTVRLGEWVDLGAIAEKSSEVNRTILQSASTHADERVRISLKVE